MTEATRQRVEVAAAELGYAPSAHAAALARGRSNAIGVVTPWISRWFFATVTEGVHEVVSEAGYDMLLYPIRPTANPQAAQLDALALHKRVDGVVGLALPAEMRMARTVSNIPTVTVGTFTDGIPGVGVDDRAVGYLATRHLLELGHQRIAFLGLDPDDLYGLRVADDRYQGYLRALREATVEPDPRLTITTGFEVEGGESALSELLARAEWQTSRLPTAIVAVSDEVAMGVIYAGEQFGIRVPEDISVVGVDDHDMARLLGLTTVAQPVIEQGRIAATMLLGLMRQDGRPAPESARLAPGLVVRRTTAPPRAT